MKTNLQLRLKFNNCNCFNFPMNGGTFSNPLSATLSCLNSSHWKRCLGSSVSLKQPYLKGDYEWWLLPTLLPSNESTSSVLCVSKISLGISVKPLLLKSNSFTSSAFLFFEQQERNQLIFERKKMPQHNLTKQTIFAIQHYLIFVKYAYG